MANTRDEKRDRFSENKDKRPQIKPVHILGLVIVAVGIVVAAFLLSSGSGDSGEAEVSIDGISDKPKVDLINGETDDDAFNGNEPATTDDSGISVANFEIQGMTCGGCSGAVMKALGDMEGVKSSDVSWSAKEGVVEYDPAAITPQEIAEFITEMGYPATVVE